MSKGYGGILSPKEAYDIVRSWKDEIGLPVQVHSHYTSGMAAVSYVKAVEAGADVIDCAISAMSMSTSQPPVESLVAAFEGTVYDTGLDLNLLSEISEYFKTVRTRYGTYDKASPVPDANVLRYQIPGGMISTSSPSSRARPDRQAASGVGRSPPRLRPTWGIRLW